MNQFTEALPVACASRTASAASSSSLSHAEEEAAYYGLQRKVWSAFAPFYDVVTLPLRRLRDEVASMLPLHRGTRILDVATGTGAQAHAFAKKAGQVVGIDLSEDMLRIAKSKRTLPNIEFVRADATKLPFADRSFDAACVSFALHEMPRSIRKRVLREMVRVTKPGGPIVVVDYALPRHPIARNIVFRVVKMYERDHYAEFVRSSLRAMLTDAGVEIRHERSALGGIVKICLGRRLELRERASWCMRAIVSA